MKIIIFGSNGMLGSYLKLHLEKEYSVMALTRKDIDLSFIDEARLLAFMFDNIAANDVVVNACGVIKQRDYNVIEMLMVNSIFPHILAKFKKYVGCDIIHITTDCVFSGSRGGYVESDNHDCIDDYGKSKSLGENLTITNIRTSIIGEEKLNKRSLLEWVISNKGRAIDGYQNHFWNGITCLELSKLIKNIIKNNSFWSGVKHVFSPDIVSKYELVTMINDVYDLNMTISKKQTDKCYRDLSTSMERVIEKPLYEQILELKDFNLKEKIKDRKL